MGKFKRIFENGSLQLFTRIVEKETMQFVLRLRNWEYRQLPVIHRASRPSRPDKARRLGYKAKQGFVVYRVAVRMRSRKLKVAKDVVDGKPKSQGVNQCKLHKNLRAIAEERADRKLPSLRVLNSYWVGQDGTYKFYEVIMVDPSHNAIRNDPRMNWICKPVHRHRAQHGVTAAAKKSRGLAVRGNRDNNKRPS